MIFLGVGDFNEVVYFLYHAADRGGVFFHYGVVHLVKAERVEGALLNCGAVDAALYLGDFDLCHCRRFLAFEYFFN